MGWVFSRNLPHRNPTIPTGWETTALCAEAFTCKYAVVEKTYGVGIVEDHQAAFLWWSRDESGCGAAGGFLLARSSLPVKTKRRNHDLSVL